MNTSKIAQNVTVEDCGDGFMLHKEIDEQFAGVKVTDISLYVHKDEDEGCGDLAVTWSTDGLENTGGGDMGMLLMRGDNDEVGAVMGEFYWENGFTARLKELLVDMGFSEAAADDVATSEWGMQDEGRASYDAYAIAEEVRNAMLETA